MKTIIAPIDFSDASYNALLFAAELSKRTSALLIVVHVASAGDDEKEVNNKLDYATANLHKNFGADLSIEICVYAGKSGGDFKRTDRITSA